MKKPLYLILIFVLITLIVPTLAFSQQVINNPKKPTGDRAGRVMRLEEEMRITDEQGGFYFKSPENIKIAPDGSIFVLDENQFLKFDNEGKFLKNLFKKGQGPGEFQRISDYLFSENKIVVLQGQPNKIVLMDMQGKLSKEFKPEQAATKMISFFDGKYIMAHSTFPKLKKMGEEPEIIDIDWNVRFVFEDTRVEETDLKFPVKWYAKRIQNAIIANFIVDFTAKPIKDKFLVVYHTQNYLLKLLDLESREVIRTFSRKYKRIKFKPEKTGRVEIRPNMYTLVPPVDNHNDIQKLFIREDKIWVMTSTTDKQKGFLVDVFDTNGKYIDNFYIPLLNSIKLAGLNKHPITVSGDFMFIVDYGKDDIPSLVKYRMRD